MEQPGELRFDRASDLLERHRTRLRTGCARMDEVLGGGLLDRGITEIAGEASAGKTQLALQLIFQVQLPRSEGGLQGGALFLHAEGGEAPVKRLRQIGSAFARRWSSAGATVDRLCDNVFIDRIETADLLMNALRYRVPTLLATRAVRLVVIDSIAALFRTHLDDDLPRRSELLHAIAAEMQALSDRMHVAFVVLNQITDSVDTPDTPDAACTAVPAVSKRAALGLAWSHCVNTRLLLSRAQARPFAPPRLQPQLAQLGGALAEQQPRPGARVELRTMRVVLSPCVEQRSCEYVIDADGVRDATDDETAHG